MAITSANGYVDFPLLHHCVCKITGHTNTNTPNMLELVKYTIFLRPKKAVLLVLQKLLPG